MVERGCRRDAEATGRGGDEGGFRGFQGAAGSQSTKTDAVEQLEQRERGEKCVRVFLCAGGGKSGGANCKHHTTVSAAANQPSNDLEPGGVSGWVVMFGGFCLGGKGFTIKALTKPQSQMVGVQAVGVGGDAYSLIRMISIINTAYTKCSGTPKYIL